MSADPDVAAAIPELVRAGLVTPEQAAPLLREAAGERFSLRLELRAILWAGVSLLTAGVGLLVRQEYLRIGPLAIAVALALASAGAFAWVVRHAAPFTWDEASSSHLAFDYLLTLGALLAAADLAWIEARFTPLGPSWPWHLLVVAVAFAALAVRFDSTLLFGLALGSLAAWRGVAASGIAVGQFRSLTEPAVRWNALGCGVLFVLLGAWLARSRRKPHFEPVATTMGVGLGLAALWAGALRPWPDEAPGWVAALIVAGLSVAAWFRRARRFGLFALGIGAAYLAFARVIVETVGSFTLLLVWFGGSSLGLIVWLWREQRRLRGHDEA